MAAIGEKEIKALIRSGDIGGAFLLFGTESYLKEFYSSKLKDKAVSPDFADFNYHFFDGASCTLEDIEQADEQQHLRVRQGYGCRFARRGFL